MSRTFRFLVSLALSLLPAAPVLALTPADVAGEYTGVVDNGSFEQSGYFRLVIGKGGRGSVAVRLGDEPTCVIFIGFEGDGGVVPRPGGDPDMLARLIFIIGDDGKPKVTGEVEDDGHIFPVDAEKTVTDPGPAIGRHTFMIGSTPGIGNTGAGQARVTASGRVTGAATVKGGKAVAFGGRLSSAQKLPISTRLGRTDRSLVGNVTFGNPVTAGNVALHTETGDQPLLVGGAPYNPRQPALTGAGASFPLDVKLSGVVSGYAIRARNGSIVGGRLNGAPLRLAVNRSTGFVTGRSGTQAFRGIVLQGENMLAGLVNGTSTFEVLPGTGNPAGAAGLEKSGNGSLQMAGGNGYIGAAAILGGGAINIVGVPNIAGGAFFAQMPGGWVPLVLAVPEYNLELGLALQAIAAAAQHNAANPSGPANDPAVLGGTLIGNSGGINVNGGIIGTVGWNTVSGTSSAPTVTNGGSPAAESVVRPDAAPQDAGLFDRQQNVGEATPR